MMRRITQGVPNQPVRRPGDSTSQALHWIAETPAAPSYLAYMRMRNQPKPEPMASFKMPAEVHPLDFAQWSGGSSRPGSHRDRLGPARPKFAPCRMGGGSPSRRQAYRFPKALWHVTDGNREIAEKSLLSEHAPVLGRPIPCSWKANPGTGNGAFVPAIIGSLCLWTAQIGLRARSFPVFFLLLRKGARPAPNGILPLPDQLQ